ncbi:MAG: hypothetical protein ACTHK4_01850 [Mycobacteriales bacterium]
MSGVAKIQLPVGNCLTSATGTGSAVLHIRSASTSATFAMTFYNVAYLTDARFLLTGGGGGLAYGEHTAPTDLQQAGSECAAGKLKGGLLTLSFTTVNPLHGVS